MPSVAEIDGYKFFFYSNEGNEPPHVHVKQGNKLAKFWLEEVSVAKCTRFADHEIARIKRLVVRHRTEFLGEWYEFFGKA